VYFALGSIIGNTFVSDAAAKTVGVEPPEAAAVLDDADVAGAALVELELLELPLLPQPTANAETPIVASTAATRPPEFTLNNRTSSLAHQNPVTKTESWQPYWFTAIVLRS
jgi:hypothetical protein